MLDLAIVIAASLLCPGTLAAPGMPAAQQREAPLLESRQLLVVVTETWNAVAGTLLRFERETAEGSWKPVGPGVAVAVGRNGLAWGRGVADDRVSGGPVKAEGDGKAPAGVFRLGTSFGQSPQPPAGAVLPYRFLDGNVQCVDDARSAQYNKLVTTREVDRVDWSSSERMWTEPLYKWGIVVEHNAPDVEAGAGSCIFLHVWKGADAGTAGCTAMSEQYLTAILRWLRPAARPLFVQLPRAEYDRLSARWGLPPIR
jgi:D-alanyl-D-alanine dipeptidase